MPGAALMDLHIRPFGPLIDQSLFSARCWWNTYPLPRININLSSSRFKEQPLHINRLRSHQVARRRRRARRDTFRKAFKNIDVSRKKMSKSAMLKFLDQAAHLEKKFEEYVIIKIQKEKTWTSPKNCHYHPSRILFGCVRARFIFGAPERTRWIRFQQNTATGKEWIKYITLLI